MPAKDLFGSCPYEEEVEELFDAWTGRDFEDVSAETFFALLKEIEAHRPPQYVETEEVHSYD